MAQVARVSPRRLGFRSGPVHVRFVVAKTALEPVSILVFQILPVRAIPPMVYTDLRHNTVIPRLKKIICSGITFVSRNELLEWPNRSCLLLYVSARIH